MLIGLQALSPVLYMSTREVSPVTVNGGYSQIIGCDYYQVGVWKVGLAAEGPFLPPPLSRHLKACCCGLCLPDLCLTSVGDNTTRVWTFQESTGRRGLRRVGGNNQKRSWGLCESRLCETEKGKHNSKQWHASVCCVWTTLTSGFCRYACPFLHVAMFLLNEIESKYQTTGQMLIIFKSTRNFGRVGPF